MSEATDVVPVPAGPGWELRVSSGADVEAASDYAGPWLHRGMGWLSTEAGARRAVLRVPAGVVELGPASEAAVKVLASGVATVACLAGTVTVRPAEGEPLVVAPGRAASVGRVMSGLLGRVGAAEAVGSRWIEDNRTYGLKAPEPTPPVAPESAPVSQVASEPAPVSPVAPEPAPVSPVAPEPAPVAPEPVPPVASEAAARSRRGLVGVALLGLLLAVAVPLIGLGRGGSRVAAGRKPAAPSTTAAPAPGGAPVTVGTPPTSASAPSSSAPAPSSTRPASPSSTARPTATTKPTAPSTTKPTTTSTTKPTAKPTTTSTTRAAGPVPVTASSSDPQPDPSAPPGPTEAITSCRAGGGRATMTGTASNGGPGGYDVDITGTFTRSDGSVIGSGRVSFSLDPDERVTWTMTASYSGGVAHCSFSAQATPTG